MSGRNVDFGDRLATAAAAKQALLEKARAKANDPELARKQAERAAIAAAAIVDVGEPTAPELCEQPVDTEREARHAGDDVQPDDGDAETEPPFAKSTISGGVR